MRLSAIDNIEKDGEFKNLPTINELKLMENLCTTISHEKIDKIIKILDGEILSENLGEDQGRCTECIKPITNEPQKQTGGNKQSKK